MAVARRPGLALVGLGLFATLVLLALVAWSRRGALGEPARERRVVVPGGFAAVADPEPRIRRASGEVESR